MQWIRKRLKSATDHGTEPCQKRQVLILGMGAIKLKSFSEVQLQELSMRVYMGLQRY
jgi:hypothetical protein